MWLCSVLFAFVPLTVIAHKIIDGPEVDKRISSITQLQEKNHKLIKALRQIDVFNTLWTIKDDAVSDECKDSLMEMHDIFKESNFSTHTLWALAMVDSSAGIPYGLEQFSMWHLGHYDQCLDIQHPEGKFSGRHCMLDFNVSTDVALHYAVCIPSTCKASDINSGFAESPVPLPASTTEEQCQTKVTKEAFDTGDWVVVSILILIIINVIAMTAYHIIHINFKSHVDIHPFSESFSLITSCQELFVIKKGGEQMESLHGIRTISMAWIVLSHAYAQSAAMPMINLKDIQEASHSERYMVIWNGVFGADTFFFISGLLVAFSFLREVSRRGQFDIPLKYIHRYLRLTSSLMLVIAVHMTIYRHFGDGPLWMMHGQTDACKSKWWTTILYVNNYVEPEAMCLPQSWYLSVDMQLYWLSPIFLLPLVFWPKLGTLLLVFYTIGATLINFILDLGLDNLSYSYAMQDMEQKMTDFLPTHARAAPWFVGLVLGVIISYLKNHDEEVYIPGKVVAIAWTLSTIICLGCIFGPLRFIYGPECSHVEVAVYLAFSRLGWGCALAWIVFACIYDYGGPIKEFLSLGFFQPLSKLSYSVFLVHVSLQVYRIGTLRTNTFFGVVEMIYYFIADYVLSNLLGILLFVFVEAPVAALDRNFLKTRNILPFPRKTIQSKGRDKQKKKNVPEEHSLDFF